MTLMRFDPFRELDRWTEQALSGNRNIRTMPMEALRRTDRFLVALDLPGVTQEDIDVTVERNVVTIRASRARSPGRATRSSSTRGPTASSAGSCSWARTSTPANSPPTSPTECSTSRSPSPKPAHRARSPLATAQQPQPQRDGDKSPPGAVDGSA
jgi:hypothetical protein